jgi:hypothetical protein
VVLGQIEALKLAEVHEFMKNTIYMIILVNVLSLSLVQYTVLKIDGDEYHDCHMKYLNLTDLMKCTRRMAQMKFNDFKQ